MNFGMADMLSPSCPRRHGAYRERERRSNFKDISCGKCAAPLGKMYFATTSKLSALQSDISLLSVSRPSR